MKAYEKERVLIMLSSYKNYKIINDEKYLTDYIESRVRDHSFTATLPERVFLRIIKNR